MKTNSMFDKFNVFKNKNEAENIQEKIKSEKSKLKMVIEDLFGDSEEDIADNRRMAEVSAHLFETKPELFLAFNGTVLAGGVALMLTGESAGLLGGALLGSAAGRNLYDGIKPKMNQLKDWWAKK